MSLPNVSPKRPAVNPRGRQLLIVALVLLIVVFALRTLFGAHENKYEKLAREVTVALQSNDVDAVKKYQNAETATHVTRGVVGRAADVLSPLGKIKSVKETTPKDAPDRTHEFDVAFEKGAIHERMKVDPESKIVTFRYEKAAP